MALRFSSPNMLANNSYQPPTKPQTQLPSFNELTRSFNTGEPEQFRGVPPMQAQAPAPAPAPAPAHVLPGTPAGYAPHGYVTDSPGLPVTQRPLQTQPIGDYVRPPQYSRVMNPTNIPRTSVQLEPVMQQGATTPQYTTGPPTTPFSQESERRLSGGTSSAPQFNIPIYSDEQNRQNQGGQIPLRNPRTETAEAYPFQNDRRKSLAEGSREVLYALREISSRCKVFRQSPAAAAHLRMALSHMSNADIKDMRDSCTFIASSMDQCMQQSPPSSSPSIIRTPATVSHSVSYNPRNGHLPISPKSPLSGESSNSRSRRSSLLLRYKTPTIRSTDTGRRGHNHTRSDPVLPRTRGSLSSVESSGSVPDQLSLGETVSLKVDPIRLATDYTGEEFVPQGVLQQDLSIKPKLKCMQCGSESTPEWRKGPENARTLCNACGLFHNKLVKSVGTEAAAEFMREKRARGKPSDRKLNHS